MHTHSRRFCVHTCTFVHTHAHSCMCTHVLTLIHIHTPTCTQHSCAHVYRHMPIRTSINTHAGRTFTHTQTHTSTHSHPLFRGALHPPVHGHLHPRTPSQTDATLSPPTSSSSRPCPVHLPFLFPRKVTSTAEAVPSPPVVHVPWFPVPVADTLPRCAVSRSVELARRHTCVTHRPSPPRMGISSCHVVTRTAR